MNLKVISRNVGFALLASAFFMFLSILVSIANGNDSALAALTISFTLTFTVGIFPFIFVRKSPNISLKDGYMIIVLSWLLSFIFGMLPYVLWGGPFSVINALFETVSGYTTTGGTVLSSVEQLPDSLLFWRSSTHFIGGLGVVVFLLLIIPSSSPIRLRLTNMEVSSLSREGSLQSELLNLIQSIVADEPFACGAAVESLVMREDEDTVFGKFEIQFHNISTHSDNGLDGRDGILRVISPVASVTSDYNIL